MKRTLDIYKTKKNNVNKTQTNSQIKTSQPKIQNTATNQTKMQSEIKTPKNRKLKRFFRASAVVLFGATLLFGGGLYSHNQTKDYASKEQIEEISNALNCDMSYMFKVNNNSIKIFQHNNGEPIYVSLPDGATKTTYEAINQSLDYMFNIMEQINPRYTYKIVSKDELSSYKAQGKSTIEFKRSTLPLQAGMSAEATAQSDKDLTSIFTFGKMVDNYTITYDANDLENEYESLENSCETFLHELLHVFSFDDIYEKDAVYATTYIHPSVGEKYDAFLPNDLKCLISTYAPKFKSETEKQEYILKMKQLVSNYEQTFYKDIIDNEKRSTTAPIESENVSLLLKDSVKLNKQNYDYYYKIEIKDGIYTFEILDSNKKVIDKTQGEAILVDGVYVLKSACLKYGLSTNLERVRQGNKAIYENLLTDLRIYKYKKTIYDEDYSCLIATNFTLPEHCEVEESKGFKNTTNDLEDNKQ